MASGKKIKDIEDEMDDAAVAPRPKTKTPEEMKQNPNDLLEPEVSQTLKEQQDKLDRTWQVGIGEQDHDKETKPALPGSGASEGRGSHKWGVYDNS
jgi:hypothetical protein